MNIDVTAADIAAGRRADPRACPLALALKRQAWPYIDVGAFDVRIYGEDQGDYELEYPRCRVALPAEAYQFRYDFDYGNQVSPFSFEIDWPSLGASK